MTYLEAEKKIVQYLADLLQLIPDREIFAGDLPDGVPEGVCIDLKSGFPAGQGQVNTFTVLLNGQFYSRSVCREKAFAVTSSLPVFGQSGLLSLRTDAEVPLEFSGGEAEENGYHWFSLKLIVTFI